MMLESGASEREERAREKVPPRAPCVMRGLRVKGRRWDWEEREGLLEEEEEGRWREVGKGTR